MEQVHRDVKTRGGKIPFGLSFLGSSSCLRSNSFFCPEFNETVLYLHVKLYPSPLPLPSLSWVQLTNTKNQNCLGPVWDFSNCLLHIFLQFGMWISGLGWHTSSPIQVLNQRIKESGKRRYKYRFIGD